MEKVQLVLEIFFEKSKNWNYEGGSMNYAKVSENKTLVF
jgi:hypothetical protein